MYTVPRPEDASQGDRASSRSSSSTRGSVATSKNTLKESSVSGSARSGQPWRPDPYLWEYLFLMALSLSSGGADRTPWSFLTTGAKSAFW